VKHDIIKSERRVGFQTFSRARKEEEEGGWQGLSAMLGLERNEAPFRRDCTSRRIIALSGTSGGASRIFKRTRGGRERERPCRLKREKGGSE